MWQTPEGEQQWASPSTGVFVPISLSHQMFAHSLYRRQFPVPPSGYASLESGVVERHFPESLGLPHTVFQLLFRTVKDVRTENKLGGGRQCLPPRQRMGKRYRESGVVVVVVCLFVCLQNLDYYLFHYVIFYSKSALPPVNKVA